MSIKLDPKDVLEYLNELGYKNITAQQLKAFIIDLKTLIKYDQKTEKENQENIPNLNYLRRLTAGAPVFSENKYVIKSSRVRSPVKPQSAHYYHEEKSVNVQKVQKEKPRTAYSGNKTCTCGYDKSCRSPSPSRRSERNKLICTHLAPTVSSRARSKAGSDVVAITECERPKIKTFVSIASEASNFPSDRHYTSKCTFDTNSDLHSAGITETDTFSRPDAFNFMQKRTRPKSGPPLKPKVSFIRPQIPIHKGKSDPVALYHQYQAAWKKQKLPGEDNHNDLRWAIREKMMGGPSVKSTINYLQPKKSLNRL